LPAIGTYSNAITEGIEKLIIGKSMCGKEYHMEKDTLYVKEQGDFFPAKEKETGERGGFLSRVTMQIRGPNVI